MLGMPNWVRRFLQALGLLGDANFLWATLGVGSVVGAVLTGVIATAQSLPWWAIPPMFFGIFLLVAGTVSHVVRWVYGQWASQARTTTADEIADLRRRVNAEDRRVRAEREREFIRYGRQNAEDFRRSGGAPGDIQAALPQWRADVDAWEQQIVREVINDDADDVDEFMAPISEDTYGASDERGRLATRYEIRTRRLQLISDRRRSRFAASQSAPVRPCSIGSY